MVLARAWAKEGPAQHLIPKKEAEPITLTGRKGVPVLKWAYVRPDRSNWRASKRRDKKPQFELISWGNGPHSLQFYGFQFKFSYHGVVLRRNL